MMRAAVGLILLFLVLILLNQSKPEVSMLAADQQIEQPLRFTGYIRKYDESGLREVRPPDRFTKSRDLIVRLGRDKVKAQCGGGKVIACATKYPNGVREVVIADPCEFPKEIYATLLCHEKGHVLGWPGKHGA